MNIRCIKCKGRDPSICGRTFCPIVAKISAQKKVNIEAKEEYFGESPNVFVGRFGYPNVKVGVLSVENYQEHDNPLLWSRENYDIARIINLRSRIINSNFKAQITGFKERFMEMSQEIGMAKKPVDMEIWLSKKPRFSLSFNQDTMPHGPSIKLKKARITENPKIPSKVEKVVGDIDLKAGKALNQLYKKNIDEHYLTRLLSIGTLGVKKQRKLVPTRFAITAVDSNLGNELVKEIKNYQQTGYLAYFGGWLGNYYLIMFFPEIYSYELFETYMPNASWNIDKNMNYTTDYEPYEGRKSYAENCAGGFYSARLAILEKLAKIKRQASVLAIRIITGEYYAPLGVWVTRETTRKTLSNKPLEFGSKELMLTYAQHLARKKFGLNISEILQKSTLLNTIKTQSKLTWF